MGAPQYEQAGADIGGTGTANTIPRWTGPSTLGDSIITQSGTSRIGVTGAIWCDAAGGVGGVAFGMVDSASIRQTGTNTVMYFDASTTGGNGQFVWRSGNSFTESARIDSAGRLLVGTTGTPSSAAVRVVVAANSGGQQWHSQGLGGCAVVASTNTAQWYVYPGANVGSEGYLSSVKLTETGLDVTTASATPGIKLPATPGNADTQTLDCYQEGTWAPTLTGFGGTNPTVTARYTRVGRMVSLQVYITATGGATFSSTAATTYISLPAGMSPAVSSPGATSNSGIAADGPCVAYTNGNLYLPTFALRSTDTFLNVTYTV